MNTSLLPSGLRASRVTGRRPRDAAGGPPRSRARAARTNAPTIRPREGPHGRDDVL